MHHSAPHYSALHHSAWATSPFRFLVISATAVALSWAGAPPVSTAQSRTPPPRAVETMKKAVRLGKAEGFRAELRAIEITDRRFHPFLVRIDVSGSDSLSLERARFVTDRGELTLELTPGSRSRWRGPAFANAPSGPDSQLSVTRSEQRTFQLDLQQARLLAETDTLEVTLFGRVHELSYEASARQLSKLRAWLLPRVDAWSTGSSPDRR